MQVSYGIAFLAGLFSFLSPCVLPLVPGYMCFLSGLSFDKLERGIGVKEIIKKSGAASLFFVAGFSTVFIILGASASYLGSFLTQHFKLFAKAAGLLIIVLGFYLLGFIKSTRLDKQKRLEFKKFSGNPFLAFLTGLAFAFAWIPCVGPILAAILALAATQETLRQGVFLLLFYSLGLGVPFIVAGFSLGFFMRFFCRYKRFIFLGKIAAGLLLIGLGLLLFFSNFSFLLNFIPDFFYRFAK